MKQALLKNSSITILYALIACFSIYVPSSATLPNYGIPVWNNVVTDLAVDITTLSKLCIIDSSLPYISTISDIEHIAASLSNIESYVSVVDPRVITIESTLDNLNQFVQSTIESKVEQIIQTDLSILSSMQVIDTRTESIYSLDTSIASEVEINFGIDQTILSSVEAIDSYVSNITVNCSGIDQLAQESQSILSTVQVIDTRTESIHSTNQTILSYVEDISAQEIIIGSLIGSLNEFVTTTIQSIIEDISQGDLPILSTVNVIDTRTNSIYSLDQVISSEIDVNTTIESSIGSIVDIIDSKVGVLHLDCSTLAQIIETDQTKLSKLSEIETKLTDVQSNVENIYSFEQIIASDVSNIYSLDQIIASKMDTVIVLDRSIESAVNLIDSALALPCSAIDAILANDLTVLSLLNVIDTRVDAIQSEVADIYNLSSSISSKVDVNIDLDLSIQSNVNIIDTRTDILQSSVENVSILNDAIHSTLEFLSACCTGTTANQPFTTIYGTQLIENRIDNISLQFQYGIPPTVTPYTQGGGTITASNSVVTLSAAASANSIAQLQTQNMIVCRPGHEAYAYFTVAFTGSFSATSSQLIGPFDYQNGFAVGFDGPTFGVMYRTNTVNIFIPQSQFNGDKLDGTGPSGFVYNPALLNVFRISYGAPGASITTFQIMNSFGVWITFHTLNFINNSSIPAITQPFLPITARVENLTGTSGLSMRTVSWNGGTIGNPNNSSYKYYQKNIKNVTINIAPTFVLVLRNKTIFNNQPNKIQVKMMAVGGGAASSGGTARPVIISFIRNATLTGTSFSDIDTGNSVMEVSTTGSFSGGRTVWVNPAAANGNGATPQFIPYDTYNIILLPGDTLTISGTGSTDGIGVAITIAWEEQF